MRRWSTLSIILSLPSWPRPGRRRPRTSLATAASSSSSCPRSRPPTTGTRKRPSASCTRSRPHYNTLLRVDPFDKTGTKPVGDLAESWTVSKDQLTYTFKIRKGVKFHDGSEMTSKDVKASYDKILHPPAGVKSLRKEAYESIAAVDAPDPTTFVVKLKLPGVLDPAEPGLAVELHLQLGLNQI